MTRKLAFGAAIVIAGIAGCLVGSLGWFFECLLGWPHADPAHLSILGEG